MNQNQKNYGTYALNFENQSESDSIWTPEEDMGMEDQDDDDFFKNKIKKKKQPKNSIFPKWGFGLGVAPTTIQVKNSTSLYNLKTTNFIVKISYDLPLQRYFSILLGTSILPVSASQADSQLGFAKFEANYTAFEANLRLNIFGSKIQGPWIGGGGSYLYIGKGSSNIVSSTSITSRLAYQINIGYNASMGSEYLMFRADYYLHPTSQSANGYVKISQTVFSANYFF